MKPNWDNIRVGDVFETVSTGNRFIITHKSSTHILYETCTGNKMNLYRTSWINRNCILVETNTQQNKENTMNKLFQIKDSNPEIYGHKIGVNSSGLVVFEVKGTGEIKTLDKDSIEEVFPYTVSVKFSSNSAEYSYFAKKGQFKVGEVIITGTKDGNYYGIAVVTALDTKSDKATKELTGRRVLTEEIK